MIFMKKPDESITWSQLIADLASKPSDGVKEIAKIVAHNFSENWLSIIFAIIGFILARYILFSLIDIIVPRSLKSAPPSWAKNRFVVVWRDKLYKQSLESRSLYRARAIVSLTKSFIDPIMIFIAFSTICGRLGIVFEKNTITVFLGTFGIAIALGAQGIVKDVIAGITVIATDSYAVGDYIDVLMGASGIVRKIGLRLTELEGYDGTIWFVRHSEVPKVGNRTASRSRVVTDVTLTWNKENYHITSKDLKFAEGEVENTLWELSETLTSVDKAARENAKISNDNISYTDIAVVVPDLIPTMNYNSLLDMKQNNNDLSADDTNIHMAIKRIPGRVPVFTRIETLGLINATKNSITLRLRITIPPNSSRSQGMAVLRRAIFDTFIDKEITPEFNDAPEGSLILSGMDEEITNQK